MQGLGVRPGVIDGAISISAVQVHFLTFFFHVFLLFMKIIYANAINNDPLVYERNKASR